MLPGRHWLRRLASLAALGCGAAVGASVSIPAADGWAAHPDDQFLLEVRIRQLRLGDGVRAYSPPEGPCIVFGDFLAALDVPVKVDVATGKAAGWAFSEARTIAIDLPARQASFAGKAEAIAPGTVRETPEGWCVQAPALARWFGI